RRNAELLLLGFAATITVAGADAAYVCRGRVCDLPVTRTPELAAALGAPAP
ncbi:hypothetical protein, partial [Mycobacterium avium]|uniref:hypothetical protein n=1 Tax=Mycobacterium avium TaxID=1764 RepID=UPI00355B98FE